MRATSRLAALLFAFVICTAAPSAFGACTNPVANGGGMIFNNTYSVMQYCNGTTWINMGAYGGGGIGSMTTTARDALAPTEGTIIYNSTTKTLQLYNGTSWIDGGSSNGTPGGSAGAVQFNSAGTALGGDSALYWDNTNKRLGIGTTSPASALDVAGGIKIANDSAACITGKAGTVRYTGGSPPWQYCDGSTWQNFKQPRCLTVGTGECYLDATRSNDDADFVATNIKNGVDILGVTGSYTGGTSYSIINGAHTAADCTTAGGSITPYSGIYFCSFLATSCPAGWTAYNNLITTRAGACFGAAPQCGCITAEHTNSWDTSVATCTYYSVWNSRLGVCQAAVTCTATVVTGVACY